MQGERHVTRNALIWIGLTLVVACSGYSTAPSGGTTTGTKADTTKQPGYSVAR